MNRKTLFQAIIRGFILLRGTMSAVAQTNSYQQTNLVSGVPRLSLSEGIDRKSIGERIGLNLTCSLSSAISPRWSISLMLRGTSSRSGECGHEGATMKPNTSLAKKTGHFDVLTTDTMA
jgi:hypothetical protein